MGAGAASRIYPILSETLVPPERFAEVAGTLVELGVTLIQLRLKSVDDRLAMAVHAAVADRVASWPGTIVINDRADLAHLCARRSLSLGYRHRIGLHLGQADLPPQDARAIVGDALAIGLSTHDLGQLRAALEAPVDHIAFGPIFGTRSKDNPDPVVGLERLREAAYLVAGHARPRPLVAIGGIDATTIAAVLAAGASLVAVIGALFEAGPEHVATRFEALSAAAANVAKGSAG